MSSLRPRSSGVEFLVTRVAQSRYGIPIAVIREILRPLPITDVPRAPKHVRGVASVRGDLVTVLDAGLLFAERACLIGPKTRMLLFEAGGEKLVLLVDEVEAVHRMTSEVEAPTVLGRDPAPYIEGVVRVEGQAVVLLKLEVIVGR